jgi:hypothetical protein
VIQAEASEEADAAIPSAEPANTELIKDSASSLSVKDSDLVVDDAAIALALQKDTVDETSEKSSSADGDEEVVDGDDFAEEEKQLREENR